MGWRFWKKNRKLTKSQIKTASSTQFLYDGDVPRDPKEALAKAERLLKDAGYRFVQRTDTFEHGQKFTMTLRKRIALAADWDKRSDESKAKILWHELVHVRQRKAWGHTKFLARYATAEGRWMIEVPAYRESLRMMKRIGTQDTSKQLAAYISHKVDSMRGDYGLKKLEPTQYRRETSQIWRREL